MAVGAITKTSVDQLKPKLKNGQPTEDHLWDPKLSGFGVKVTPGGVKSYVVQYRMGGREAPTRRYTIGAHGSPWTPAKARDKADEILQLVKQGIDPQEQKKAKKREAVDLAFDKYAKHFLEQYGERSWSENNLANNRRNLTGPNSAAVAVLGRKPLPEIKRADISAVFDRIPAEKTGLARTVYSGLHRLFAWAVERGDIERSPFEGFKGPTLVSARDHVLSDEELRLAWLASHELSYPFGPMYRLLIATGQRREEVASLSWAELNRDRREWTLPAARSKNKKLHVVPLNDLAVAELDSIACQKWPREGFVFTTTGETAVSGYSRAKSRLDSLMAEIAAGEAAEGGDTQKIEPWRVHDLRRTFATGMQRLGVRFEVTEAILNHVSGSKGGVAGIYQRHDWRDEKRAALELWAQHLVLLFAGLDLKRGGKLVQQIARLMNAAALDARRDNVVQLHA